MNPHYTDVARRAGHRCEYCHAPEVVFNFPFEVEHVTPSSAGGDDVLANLALACRSCNLYKATRETATDPDTQEEVRLFHPREDRWEQQFQVDPESGEIAGRTPVGRATVVCLEMNSPAQLLARSQWMRLGLFP
jgi:hypothetical protein